MSIAVALYRFLKSHGWEKDIVVVGCNCTNINIGSSQGCIPYLEKLLGYPVEWNVFLLHGNELPFCALFALYHDKTSGPHSFQGPLEKELQGYLTMRKPVWFAKIRNNSFPMLPELLQSSAMTRSTWMTCAGVSSMESWPMTWNAESREIFATLAGAPLVIAYCWSMSPLRTLQSR